MSAADMITSVLNPPQPQSNGGIWKWLAVTLTGVVISGVSFVLGYGAIDSRVARLELAMARVEAQQSALAERQARDTSDVRERLTRIEGQLDRVAAWITSAALNGR